MGIQEQEALARQLWSIHREALGYMNDDYPDWEHEQPEYREAWIQVAQFVIAQNPPQVIVFNNTDLPKDVIEKLRYEYENAWKSLRIYPAQVISGYDDYPDHK